MDDFQKPQEIEVVWDDEIQAAKGIPEPRSSFVKSELSRRADMKFKACIPAKIANRSFPITTDILSQVEYINRQLDGIYANHILSEALFPVLLRSEAINSSRIEGYQTNMRNLAITIASGRGKSGPMMTVRNLEALVAAQVEAAKSQFSISNILRIHSTLMKDESFAGKIRTEQNWIGPQGPDTAVYVPPPAEYVVELLDDLVSFVNTTNIPPISAIPIVHGQFEAIHPFEDGNGRTGRAISQVILLKNGYPPIPISVGLYKAKRWYYEALNDFAKGEMNNLIDMFLQATSSACRGLLIAQKDILDLQNKIASDMSDVKPNSALFNAAIWTTTNPIFVRSELEAAGSIGRTRAAQIIQELAEREILSKNIKRVGLGGKEIWENKEAMKIINQAEGNMKIM